MLPRVATRFVQERRVANFARLNGLLEVCYHIPLTRFLITLHFSSNIRETLVEIMALPAAAEQPSSSMLHWVGQGELPTIGTEDSELPTEPSTCIFWCAVALGALVQGNPVESVRHYKFLVHLVRHPVVNLCLLGVRYRPHLVPSWYNH